MFKIFRRVRRKLLAEGRLKRYLAYACGEIVLVVVGILIALQINNWNQDRQDRQALSGYLNSIARNVESDVEKAKPINAKRWELLPQSVYINDNIAPRVQAGGEDGGGAGRSPRVVAGGEDGGGAGRFGIEDVVVASEALIAVSEPDFLNPDLSGFESLKSSGFLAKLQGTDVEQLIFRYYNLVNEIALKETYYNESTQEAVADFWSDEQIRQAYWVFHMPESEFWRPEASERFRPVFQRILGDRSFQSALTVPFEIMVLYDNLILMGTELVRLIRTEEMQLDDAARERLAAVYRPYGAVGYPKIVHQGAEARYFTFRTASSEEENAFPVEAERDYMRFRFPALPWSGVLFFVGTGSIEQVRTKDFSVYRTLRLELRGAKGGETVLIGVKDRSNPTDGSETKIPLTLTDEWALYDLPLASFAPTDTSALFVVAAFLNEGEARTIDVRTIEYLR